jgi:hypothetical protein
MGLIGIYLGIVEKVGDPEKLGRLKVRVPTVYGIQGDQIGAVTVDNLPWALPMGLPAGGSDASGGLSMLPEIGDQVAVQFLDGEPEKPVWQWLMQTQKQAKDLQLHQYVSDNGTAGNSARAILTRYGHSLELRSDKLTLTTAEGQQVLLQTSKSASGGTAALQTPKGQGVTVNDVSESIVLQALASAIISAKSVILNAPTSALIKTERLSLAVGTIMLTIQSGSITIMAQSGASVIIDDSGNISLSAASGANLSLETGKAQLSEPTGTGSVVCEAGKVSVNAPQFVVNTAAFSVGTSMGWPVVLMSPSALAWFMAHTHSNGNNGSPTGPSIMPYPTDGQSLTMRTT